MSLVRRAAGVRAIPFAAFMLLLALRGAAPEDGSWGVDPRWLYGAAVIIVGGLMLLWRREYGELVRQNVPTPRELVLALVAGLVVFALWSQLTAPWMQIGEPAARYVPVGPDGQPMWGRIAVRWIGATLVVPVMEELFWRSFLMRWIDSPRFESVDPRRVSAKAIVLSTFVFTLAHTLWLAALIAGLVYAWLYRRTGRLWVPVVAHAVTNGVLGVWVVATGNWFFW